MEMSVSKRDRIFDQTLAKEKTEGDVKRQKLKLKRHIDNLRDKNCKLQEVSNKAKNDPVFIEGIILISFFRKWNVTRKNTRICVSKRNSCHRS